MSERKLYIARINLVGNILSYPRKHKELLNSLQCSLVSPKVVYRRKKGVYWALGDTKMVTVNEQTMVAGRLGKVRESKDIKKYSRGRFAVDSVEDFSTFVNFLLVGPAKKIVFTESSDISRDDFLTVFSKLCYANCNMLEHIELFTLTEQVEVRKAMQDFGLIRKVVVTVLPPNPGSSQPQWLIWRNYVNEAHAKKGTFIAENDEGLIAGSRFVENGLEMSEAGVGNIKLQGRDKAGRSFTVRSDEHPIQKHSEVSDDVATFAEAFYHKFLQYFKE